MSNAKKFHLNCFFFVEVKIVPTECHFVTKFEVSDALPCCFNIKERIFRI